MIVVEVKVAVESKRKRMGWWRWLDEEVKGEF